ncbi:MAG: hypothetical protein ABIJ81_02135 [Patescibacteria group bacterium]
MKHQIVKFSPVLFWDIDRQKLNYITHRRFIIGRVLKFGNLKDWRQAKQLYGEGLLRKTLAKIPDLDNKSQVFWSLILNY